MSDRTSIVTVTPARVVPLASAADRINAAHEAFEEGMRATLSLAVEAGELLLAVKEQLPHGQWLPWLAENFRGSKRTALVYMSAARGMSELDSNAQRAAHLSLRSVVKMLKKDRHAAGQLNLDGHEEPATEDEEHPTEGVTDLDALVADGRKFSTIYADPPWQYGNQATRASTDNHYPTMTVEQIAALPVGDLAAERAHLWLWTTNGFLFDCPRLFDAWGFEFKSSYVWVKPQIGIGNYVRNSHEFLLLAVRGGMVGAAKDVKSWGEFDRTAHSSKPEEIRRQVIERVSPAPRLELFGRKLVEGWTVWGNQVARTMFDAEVA